MAAAVPTSGPSVVRIVIICAALAVAALFAIGGDPSDRGLSLMVLFGVLAYFVVTRERHRWGRTMGTVSPLSIYCVFWFAYFGLFGLGAYEPNFLVALVPVSESAVLNAVFLAFLSLLLIALGYHIALMGVRAGARYVGDASQPVQWPAAVFLFLVIGWAARFVRFQGGTFGFSSGGLNEAPTGYFARVLVMADGLLLVALAILAIAAWSKYQDPSIRPRTAQVLLLGNIFPLLVLTGLASGVKGQFLTDLMPVGIMYVMLRGRPPWRFMGLIVIYLVVLYSGIQEFRADFQVLSLQERTGLQGRADAVLDRVGESWSNNPPSQHITDFYEGITDEYASNPANLAIILDQTPEVIPHLGVKRILTAPLFFLPTNMLGEQLNVGAYFAQTYLHVPPGTSVFPTQMGDLFMSGGMAALLLGEIAVGILIGLVWRFSVRDMTNRVAVVYVMIAAHFANAGMDWGSLVRTTLQYAIFYGLLLKLVLREPRKSASTQSFEAAPVTSTVP